MPRRKSALVRQYFNYNKDRDSSQCMANTGDTTEVNYGIEGKHSQQCRKTLTGNKVSNLKYHLKSHHPKIYEELLRREKKSNLQKDVKEFCYNLNDASIDSYSEKRPITTKQTPRAKLIKGLLHLVTVNGRPFSIVEDSGLSILCGSAMKEFNIRYNRRTIANLVGLAADAIRNELVRMSKNSLVSVKVDCVTKFSRYFIGLHVQVICDGQIASFTLPIKALDALKGPERDLKKAILEELAKYGISSEHIYSITTDTTANVLKPAELIDEDNNMSCYENSDQINEDKDLDEDKESDFLVDEILDAHWEEDSIIAIRCAAYCLQLTVMDTLNNAWSEEIVDTYANLLEKVRIIVKELRSPQQSVYLKRSKLWKPVLDVETRWSSTFLMLESFLSVKDYCVSASFESDNLFLSEIEWSQVEEMRVCLDPFYAATKKLQDENLTLADIYKILNICYMDTSDIGTAFSQELVMNFLKHRENIMENVSMLSAIYLDPRFSFELTDVQREQAMMNIMNIRERLNTLGETTEILPSELPDDKTFVMDLDDGEARYDRLLKAKHCEQMMQRTSQTSFEAMLHSFQAVPRLSCKMSILRFWEDNKYMYPLLYDIARIVHAVPGTQLSMERIFDQLRFVLRDNLSKLKTKNMENVLFVRANFKHLKDSFFEL